MKDILLPRLAEGVEDATVSFWHVQEQDGVKKDQDIVEMTTDKATFNVPSPCEGKIIKIYFEEGEIVRIGETLAKVEEKKG